MPNQKQDLYQQLDTTIDKMLTSPTFCKKVANGESVSLRMAAMLIDAPHPQLSPEAKTHILNQILDVAEKTTSEISSKERILETLLNYKNKQEPTLSADAKTRMFARMLDAQQHLQLDSLIVSDEALQLAKENPDPIIQAAVRLADAPLPVLSTEAKARIHEQIVSSTKPQPKRILVPNFTASIQRIAASIAILLFVSTLLAPSISADSLPGDLLYPVKRSVEKVALQFAINSENRAELHLQNAKERLEELAQLFTVNRVDVDILDDAIVSLENAVNTNPNFDEDIVFQSDLSNALTQLETTITNYNSALPSAIIQDFSNRQMRLSQALSTQEPVDIVLPIEITPEPDVIVTDEPEIEAVVTEVITEEPILTQTPEPTETIQPSPTNEIVVDTTATEEGDSSIISNPITLYVNATGTVRVRNAPSLDSNIIEYISPFASVTQIGISDDGQWIQVELVSGLSGWIAEFLLVDYPISPPSVNTTSTDASGSTDDSSSSNGSSNGNSNGSSNGNANSSSSGNANGNSNGSSNGNANSSSSGNANGNSNGSSNGNANSSSSGNSNGNANSSSSGNSNGNANSSSSGNSNGNANGNSNGN